MSKLPKRNYDQAEDYSTWDLSKDEEDDEEEVPHNSASIQEFAKYLSGTTGQSTKRPKLLDVTDFEMATVRLHGSLKDYTPTNQFSSFIPSQKPPTKSSSANKETQPFAQAVCGKNFDTSF